MSKRKQDRFVVLDDEQLEKKTKDSKNINTERSERRADTAFRKFLEACGVPECDRDYTKYSDADLDSYLSKFWFGARKDVCELSDEDDFDEDPEQKTRFYSANTLKNFRYALN